LNHAVAFFHDPLGRLVFRDTAGKEHVNVFPIRGFPISDPDYSVSICDQEGHELLWIDRLSALSTEARQVIEASLGRREFTPLIQRIVHITANSEPCEWQVETDRGPTTFVLKSDEDVRRLDQRRALIVDAYGVSYLIPDLAALDITSRNYLERYL